MNRAWSDLLRWSALWLCLGAGSIARADASAIERGRYLVELMQCSNCHTPGALLGRPDRNAYLAGSDIGWEMPRLGIFYGPNLTPDAATGLGDWTEADIIAAMREGRRPDGRLLAPSMPSRSFAVLSDDDAAAIARYLKSLPPITRDRTGPFGPGQAATGFIVRIVPQ